MIVAPRVGAWIETCEHELVDGCGELRTSPLAWGRGSKPPIPRDLHWQDFGVAPRVGAWIETSCRPVRWVGESRRGRPSRGGVDRNDHLREALAPGMALGSPLAWGRGSKLLPVVAAGPGTGSPSPLAWGRGSKHAKALGLCA